LNSVQCIKTQIFPVQDNLYIRSNTQRTLSLYDSEYLDVFPKAEEILKQPVMQST